MAVAIEVAAVVAGPQLPLAAEQHQPQARRLAERVPPRPQVRRLVERAPPRPQPELRRRLERRQLPAVEAEAEGVVVAISPVLPTLMAPSTPDSAR